MVGTTKWVAAIVIDRHTRRSRAISTVSPGVGAPSDGRCLAKDMSQYEPSRDKSSGATRRIEGPIPEYNKFDEYTGTTYFRCTECGAEALEPHYLGGCCDGGA